MRIAVTGSQGQVVRALIERAAGQDAEIILLARPAVDLLEPASIAAAIEAAVPTIIVNAAAFTAVDKAESDETLAERINATGAGAVSEAAARVRAPIVQLSTDYVFDGRLDRPYREDDSTAPLGAYGRTKLAGEAAVAAANPRHVILRTSWVYSPFGANFVKTMLRLGQTQESVRVVADQIGAPTSALDIADAILHICRRLHADPGGGNHFGIFHFAGAGTASWADFAEAIFTEAEQHGRRPVAVTRIATSDYPTAARRPANSRLDTRKFIDTYGFAPPAWRLSLPPVIARLLQTT